VFRVFDKYPVMYKRISNGNKMRRMTKAVVRVDGFVAEDVQKLYSEAGDASRRKHRPRSESAASLSEKGRERFRF
jgi:hypothetical protein